MFENKKLLIGVGAGLFVMIIIIALVAFKGKKTDKTTGVAELSPGTVTLWTPIGDKAAYQVYQDSLLEQDIVLNIVEKDPSTYEEDLVNAIASGSGPDIFLLKNDWINKDFAKISPIPFQTTRYSDSAKDYEKTYPAQVVQEMMGSRKDIYGYPLTSDPLVLYVNRGLFSELRTQLQNDENGADPVTDELLRKSPETWNEFEQIVRLLTIKNGSEIIQAGTALGEADNIENAQDILYLMMLQNGTNFQSSDGKSATFQLQQKSQRGQDEYPGTKALEFFSRFSNPNSDVYTWNDKMPNATEFFIDGKLAMMINFASRENYIQQQNPNLGYEVVPLPQVRQTTTPNGFMHYYAMSVNRNSQNIDLAWGVISFMMDTRYRSNYLQSSKRNSILFEDLGATNPGTIEGQIATAKTVSKPDVLKYDNIMLKMIKDVVQSAQPAQLSIEKAARDITALLRAE